MNGYRKTTEECVIVKKKFFLSKKRRSFIVKEERCLNGKIKACRSRALRASARVLRCGKKRSLHEYDAFVFLWYNSSNYLLQIVSKFDRQPDVVSTVCCFLIGHSIAF